MKKKAIEEKKSRAGIGQERGRDGVGKRGKRKYETKTRRLTGRRKREGGKRKKAGAAREYKEAAKDKNKDSRGISSTTKRRSGGSRETRRNVRQFGYGNMGQIEKERKAEKLERGNERDRHSQKCTRARIWARDLGR